MIINGTIRDIKVKRTRNLVRGAVDIKCSDYRLEGKFKPYERIEDFFWKIFSEKIIPITVAGTEIESGHDKFLLDADMFPASLTVLCKNDESSKYLLTCMDRQLTTTYHVWFTMDDEIFRRTLYKVELSNVWIKVKDNDNIREYTLGKISEEGFDAYMNLSTAINDVIVDGVMFSFEGTDEEDDAMYYVVPKWLRKDRNILLSSTERVGERYQWTCQSPDGMFRAEATFDLTIS
ncbi:hypothetical protein CT113_09655 [Levilactobacillus brevis]|uniref:hypothetical protein n=1 Tax=Levilactobacillus brevis TaxID=1580 RepID=UPI00040085CC|nr:hypothetical protein [Levilactobacillus brevis]ATU70575.1 hypothetical protein CT113_09655 [Levilactobacillus brevis]